MSNWKANPGPQSNEGDVNNDRGQTKEFNASAPARKTGKVGGPQNVANTEIVSEDAPKGKPRT